MSYSHIDYCPGDANPDAENPPHTSWRILELYGSQTHNITQFGLEDLLPERVHLMHGPACSICATAPELIDKTISLSFRRDVVVCSFFYMMQVPGSEKTLLTAKKQGADVTVIHSPLQALQMAREHPDKTIVLFATGYLAPLSLLARIIRQAREENLRNFLVIQSYIVVPAIIEGIMTRPGAAVDGLLLGSGNVTGAELHRNALMAWRYRIPIVASNGEPYEIFQSVSRCLHQLEEDRSHNFCHSHAPSSDTAVTDMIENMFEARDCAWRALGHVPSSGFRLRGDYQDFDAESRFSAVSASAL